MDWEKVKDEMRKGVVLVTFKKKDGTVRVMEATLADYLLPETHGSGRKPNEEVVVCFDLEKEAWRSFRKDSVIEVEFLDG